MSTCPLHREAVAAPSAAPSQARVEPATTTLSPPIARGRLPVLGHLMYAVLRPVRFMHALYSQGDVVRIYLGHLPVYVINSGQLVRSMLVSQAADFEQGRLFKKAKTIIGDCLVTSDGSQHQQARRVIQPAFHRERLVPYGELMVQLAAAHAASWRPGQAVTVTQEMLALALAIVLKALFSSDATRFGAAELPRLLDILFEGLAVHTLVPVELMNKLPTPGNRRFHAANARFRQIAGALIDAYRADGSDRGDLLSMLLLARDQETGEGLTDQQVQDSLIELITAGHKTTGVTLAWLFHELGQHPEIERRVHEELDSVLGDRPAGFADLAALEYTRRVLNETLRVHHPSFFVMKRTIAPVTLGNFRVPAGADVVFSPYALNRDPSVYPEPLTFDPDRWLPDRVPDSARHAFMPFGAGKHKCIGEAFASATMTLVVATIAKRWRLRPVPGPTVREVAMLVVSPEPLTMVATPRQP